MFQRINRAIVCIRMCVICVFYKLSIGGFRELKCQHIPSPFVSQANMRENKEKSWLWGLEAQEAKCPCQILRALL